MEQIALESDTGPRVMTVSEFTVRLRELVDREFGTVFIAGEISGCKLPSSGHYYFTLKDEEAQLTAVCYRSTARYLRFKPRDGVAVARRRVPRQDGRGCSAGFRRPHRAGDGSPARPDPGVRRITKAQIGRRAMIFTKAVRPWRAEGAHPYAVLGYEDEALRKGEI